MGTVLLILFAVGAVVGLMLHRKQHPAGATLLVVCSMLAVLAAAGKIVSSLGGPTQIQRLQGDLDLVRYTMASEFGRYLAEASAGTQALCVLSPVSDANETPEEGLKEGLDGQIPVEFTFLERDASDDLDQISLTPSKVGGLLEQFPGTDLLIVMGDLPPASASDALAALLRKRNVRLAAANVISPDILAPYYHAGVLAGGVVWKENPKPLAEVRDLPPEDIFDSQFVLIPPKTR